MQMETVLDQEGLSNLWPQVVTEVMALDKELGNSLRCSGTIGYSVGISAQERVVISGNTVMCEYLNACQRLATITKVLSRLVGRTTHCVCIPSGPSERVVSLRDRVRRPKEAPTLSIIQEGGSHARTWNDRESPTLKAIPTIYKGVTFRSRLEARWAAYFDERSEPWEFEPEGYELPSGRYLPDFWLPKFQLRGCSPGTYWEVKPTVDAIDEDKIRDLVALSLRPCCVSVGPPWDGWTFIFSPRRMWKNGRRSSVARH